MKVIVQRVLSGACTINNQIYSSIQHGYVLLVGFEYDDTIEIVQKMAKKIIKLRVFDDGSGKMNRSILDVHGEILSISQFTLYADAKKGNRPSFIKAAKPEISEPLYKVFNEELSQCVPVATGIFGADMKIELMNDGPITIILDTKEIF